MRFLTGLAAAAVLASAAAADTKVALTGENTKVEFTGTKPGGKHDGGFKKVTGTAAVGADPATAKIEVAIDTDSLYSDDPKLTGHLKSPDFFDVKTNPTATFVSTKVAKDGDGYQVTGALTINGKKKEVTFPAKITAAGGAFKLTAEFKIKRLDWGVGTKFDDGKISDEVAIRLAVDAKS